MKYIVTCIILMLSIKALPQTAPPVLIINLEKIGIYEDIVDSQPDNLKIKAVVFKDFISPSSLSACIEQEDNSFTVRDNIAYVYFFDSYCNPQTIAEIGNLIVVMVKRENKLMNVFVHSNMDIGIDQTLKIENLSFKEGNYLYDNSIKDVEFVKKHILDLSNIYLTPVDEKKLRCLQQ